MAERRLRVVPAGFPESAQGGVVTLQDQMLTGKAVRPIMKLIATIIGAALLTATAFSPQCTPKKAGLYIDKADARVVHRRRTHYVRITAHRATSAYSDMAPPAPYYGYAIYAWPPKYPDGYPISYYGHGYSGYSAGYAPLGINWDNWGGWGAW